MIYYLVTNRYRTTIRRLLRTAPELRGFVRYLTYEELFFQHSAPIGHYIFSDIDRLSPYERQEAAIFARALRQAEPAAKVLNDPVLTLARVALLAALHRAGINDFTAVRLDTGERPPRYPVFIRAEDGHFGPETDVLRDEVAFDAAVRAMLAAGIPLRGRIAVGFAAKPDRAGNFRRYSAFKIGGRVFADELFVSDTWAVKDRVARWDAGTIAEELAFVRANPHRDAIAEAFAVGHIDFGRMDYGVVDGRIQVYEINTNPTFALRELLAARSERPRLVRKMIVEALRAIDTPLSARGRVRFPRAGSRPHPLRVPSGWRLVPSLAHRLGHPRVARAKPRNRLPGKPPR
jgi:hypothetical protein